MSAKYLELSPRDCHLAALRGICERMKATNPSGTLTPEQYDWLVDAAADVHATPMETDIVLVRLPDDAVRPYLERDVDIDKAERLARLMNLPYTEFRTQYVRGYIDIHPDDDEAEALKVYARMIHFPYQSVEDEFLVGNLDIEDVRQRLAESDTRFYTRYDDAMLKGAHPFAAATRVIESSMPYTDEDLELAENYGFIQSDPDVDGIYYSSTYKYAEVCDQLAKAPDPLGAYVEMEQAYETSESMLHETQAIVRKYADLMGAGNRYSEFLLIAALQPGFLDEMKQAIRVDEEDRDNWIDGPNMAGVLCIEDVVATLHQVREKFQPLGEDLDYPVEATLLAVARAFNLSLLDQQRIAGLVPPTAVRTELTGPELTNLLAHAYKNKWSQGKIELAKWQIYHGVMSINGDKVADILAYNWWGD